MNDFVATRVRQSISGNVFPPKYPDENWLDTSIINVTNCMAYALNCTYSPKRGTEIYDLETDRTQPNFSDKLFVNEELISVFEKRMNQLGIRFRRLGGYQGRRPANAYQIVLCNSVNLRDFHFARQNKNGVWSHKMGWWRLPMDICEKDESIDDYMMDLGYKVIAYYAIYKIQ